MDIILCPNAEEASLRAAALITNAVRARPATVLGLATGSTPLRLYQALIQACRDGLDFSRVRTFNLDEYLGLGPEHPASYHRFMREHFFDAININPANTHIPEGMTPGDRVPAHCAEYEQKIRDAGGIVIQVLGIGSDGHIGFNEPGSSLAARTRIKTLTARTRSDNARFFESADEVPFHVITMGTGTILEARQILLLAFGAGKADAVAGAVEGPVSASNPASVLQLHPDVKYYLDEGAAQKLSRSEYYRWVYNHKPAWQRD